jgi:hypothetical protein
MITTAAIYRAIILGAFLVAAGFAETVKTHMSDVIPSNLILSDSLDWIRTASAYPGLRARHTQTRIAAGFTRYLPDNHKYDGIPESFCEDQNNPVANLSPYLAAQLAGAHLSSGVYLGNFHTDAADHHASVPDDTMKELTQSKVHLDGAIWVAADTRVFKGASLLTEGEYVKRNAHYADIDISRRIHSLFAQKRKHGAGTLTGVFCFDPALTGIIRVGYGKDIVTATEKRLDTLWFTTDNFITASGKLDSSHEQTLAKLEVGGIARFEAMHLGLFLAGDRAHSDYVHGDTDSSRFSINVFFGKRIAIQKLELFAGLDIACQGVLYNKSESRLGYWHLAQAYTTGRMSHGGAAKASMFGAVPIGARVKAMAGFSFLYDYRLSNYDASRGVVARQKQVRERFLLHPFSVRYQPGPKTTITVSPKIDDAVVIGSAEVAYAF